MTMPTRNTRAISLDPNRARGPVLGSGVEGTARLPFSSPSSAISAHRQDPETTACVADLPKDQRQPKLHLAQVIGNLGWGGTQELITLFSTRSASLGIRTSVIVLGDRCDTPYERRLEFAHASVTYLPGRKVYSPYRFAKFVSVLRKFGPDLVHAHLRMANTLAPLAGAIVGVPVICGLHILGDAQGLRTSLRSRIEATSMRIAAKRAVACGKAVAGRHRGRLGRLPIDVVENPAPQVPDVTSVDQIRQGGRSPKSDCRFVVVGRLAPEKGVDVILDAAASMRARGVGFTLTIIGDGPLRPALERKSRDLGLANIVHFLGARNDVPDLLAQSDAIVCGSVADEGLSIALLEAMAHGLPVVATAVGDSVNLIDVDVGALVPPCDPIALAEAMETLATDPEQCREKGLNAAGRIASEFSPEQWSLKLARLYRQTIGDHR